MLKNLSWKFFLFNIKPSLNGFITLMELALQKPSYMQRQFAAVRWEAI